MIMLIVRSFANGHPGKGLNWKSSFQNFRGLSRVRADGHGLGILGVTVGSVKLFGVPGPFRKKLF